MVVLKPRHVGLIAVLGILCGVVVVVCNLESFSFFGFSFVTMEVV